MEVRLTWKKLAVGATVAGAMMVGAAFVGAKLALAVPGGETRNALSFAGTLRTAAGAPVTAATTLTFTFRKGITTVCAPTAMATPDSAGAFVAQIPIDACPRSLFDGGDVVFDVASGSNVIARDQAVNPVPYARYADQVGVGSDCPAGYARDTMASPGIVCARTVTLGGMSLRDEVVKVGVGSSAFWVDRYEASVHLTATGIQLGASNSTGGVDGFVVETSGLTVSGQRPAGEAPARALSHPGQPTVNLTWFQANEACRAAGKRMLLRDEWFAAASGTVDGAMCNVSTSGARSATASNGCVSTSGAHDMVGNISEWTSEWYASVGQVTSPALSAVGARVTGIRANFNLTPWPTTPTSYNGDATYNITSTVYNDAEGQIGVPGAAVRGGNWNDGTESGIFALYLHRGPANRDPSIGFRCVVPR